MTTINALVDRFLAWRLPATFGPDCYIAFDRERANANGSWPIGTNLFTASEAREMLEHLVGKPTRSWAVAKQHPERPEVSIFLTSDEATAKQYEGIGWTVLPLDFAPLSSGVAASPPKPQLAERLRDLAQGRIEWRVADPETGAYCIAFDREWKAQEWLDDHVKRHPTSMHANKTVQRAYVLTPLEQAALEAADLLEGPTEGGVRVPLRMLTGEEIYSSMNEARAAIALGETAMPATFLIRKFCEVNGLSLSTEAQGGSNHG